MEWWTKTKPGPEAWTKSGFDFELYSWNMIWKCICDFIYTYVCSKHCDQTQSKYVKHRFQFYWSLSNDLSANIHLFSCVGLLEYKETNCYDCGQFVTEYLINNNLRCFLQWKYILMFGGISLFVFTDSIYIFKG